MSKTLEGNIIKKAHEKVGYTEQQLQEFSMCVPEVNKDAHHYFMTHFGYLKHPKHGKQLYVPYDYQIKLIDNFHNYRFNINMLGRQMGKALAYDTPVLTTGGFKTIDCLQIGDYVYGDNGLPTRIINKTNKQDNRQIYTLNFDNNSYITADADHEWIVYDNSNNKHIKTTTELLDCYTNFYIKRSPVLIFDNSSKFDDAYEIGLGLKANSSIDSKYIYSDIQSRILLVEGFINSDICIEAGELYCSIISERLYSKLSIVLGSLGVYIDTSILGHGSVRIRIKRTDIKNIGVDDTIIRILDIIKTDSVPVYCIEVDNDNNTFLAGLGLVPTHNCVVGDTAITIKNNATGEVVKTTIKDFHEMIGKEKGA